MKSKVDTKDAKGYVVPGLKQKYRSAPPEGKMKGRQTMKKGS